MPKVSSGKCNYCEEVFSKMSIKKHLDKCEKRPQSEKKEEYFILSVQDAYRKEYWLYLKVQANQTLEALDQFLRDIWLECCGHLSSFEIDGVEYISQDIEDFGFGIKRETMKVKLNKVLFEGVQFEYTYDFGSSTILKLKVVTKETSAKIKDGIEPMARNLPPEFKCSCEKEATQVCTQCLYEGEAWFCEECAKEHECGEEMCSPIVNSPRTGVCGYCG